MDKPFAALGTCTDDLVTSWGLDAKQQTALTTRPRPLNHPNTWIRSSNYPKAMLTRGKQALVSFRLMGAEPQPLARCSVPTTTRQSAISCGLLVRRARFSPALDAKNQAVPSYYLNTVRWIMAM